MGEAVKDEHGNDTICDNCHIRKSHNIWRFCWVCIVNGVGDYVREDGSRQLLLEPGRLALSIRTNGWSKS